MQDGTYVAYAKRNLSQNKTLLDKLKKEAPTSKSRGVLPYANNIPQNDTNVKSGSSTKYSMQKSTNNTQKLDNNSFSIEEKIDEEINNIDTLDDMIDYFNDRFGLIERDHELNQLKVYILPSL